jgi:hypothetical protein
MGLKRIHRKSQPVPKQLGMIHLWKIPLSVILIIVVAVAIVAVLLVFSYSSFPENTGPGPQVHVIGNNPADDASNETDDSDTSPPEDEEQPPKDMRADLVGLSITYNNGLVSAVIANEGLTDAGEFKVEFFKSKNSLGIVNVTELKAGENKTLSLWWEPRELDYGNRKLGVEIDIEEVIDEISDRNNDYDQYAEVTEAGIYVPDPDDETGSGTVIASGGIKDISNELVSRIVNFDTKWYFRSGGIVTPPNNVEQYYDISRDVGSTYTLGVAMGGFKVEKDMGIPKVYVPVSSVSGWSSSSQITKDEDSDTCVWIGPRIVFDLEIDENYLEISDNFQTTERINVGSGKRIKSVRFLSAKKAEFDDEITMARCAGGPTPNELIPEDFYSIEGDKIYFYPVQWNPQTKETLGYFHIAFEIELD